MSKYIEKYERKRIRGSHVITVLSISLVLLLLGVQFFILGYSNTIANHVRENICVTVLFKDKVAEEHILEMKNILDNHPAVKQTHYISKDEAAKELQETLGEDFIDFLGFNPLQPIVELRLKASYAQADSIENFKEEISHWHNVKEVYYQKDLVSLVNENVKKISFWLITICLVTLIIAVSLISNTMQLLIYSKRFLINSMQLVGAQPGFIRRPFLLKGLLHSLIGALIAIVILSLILFYINIKLPMLVTAQDTLMIVSIFAGLILIGMFFTFISTYFSVNKYLKMGNTDNIYR